MKNLIIAVWSLFLLISCSSSPSNSTPTVSSSIYNPPSWIQGTWGRKANGAGQTDKAYYKFTTDNICQLTGGFSSQCWKESINTSPQILSGSETITSDTYTANFISSGGASTLTLSFKKVSATKILWINTSSGDIPLDKLN